MPTTSNPFMLAPSCSHTQRRETGMHWHLLRVLRQCQPAGDFASRCRSYLQAVQYGIRAASFLSHTTSDLSTRRTPTIRPDPSTSTLTEAARARFHSAFCSRPDNPSGRFVNLSSDNVTASLSAVSPGVRTYRGTRHRIDYTSITDRASQRVSV